MSDEEKARACVEAFKPFKELADNVLPKIHGDQPANTMTKREIIAMAAMSGFISHEEYGRSHPDNIAVMAVEHADALLAALSGEAK